MVRRLFRWGFTLGVLICAGIALVRLLRPRDDALLSAPSVDDGEPWLPLREPTPVAAPAVPEPEPARAAKPATKKTVKITKPSSRKAAKSTKAASKRVLETPGGAWVEPDNGVCPTTHPVKAKLSTKIFHVKGGASYERSVPDRCYRDAAAAESDGFRQSKI
jgi:hypothetical protein